MLCQHCGKNQATSVFTQTINGHTTKKNLCSDCTSLITDFDMEDIFAGFPFSSFLKDFNLQQDLLQGTPQTRCDKCGSSFAEIAESGKIGCANCYNVFRKELNPTIQRIHGKARHEGKRPHNKLNILPPSLNEKSPESLSRQELEKKLEEAIACQNFELAAKYRDQIKELGL